MRRFLFPLLSLGFVGFLFGCHHTAGVCDCAVGRDWCNYVSANGGVLPIHPVNAVVPVTTAPPMPVISVVPAVPVVPVVPPPVKTPPENLKVLPKDLPGKTLPPIN